MSHQSLADNLYQKLVNEEDARVCRDIDEAACREVPGNFFILVTSHFFSKLGDAIANPKVVLPWVMEAIAAPLYLLGFLVPIRESGSLIPQLVIASFIRRLPVRKWVWVCGSVIQAAAIMSMGWVAWQLSGALAGWSIIGLLILFSLARGLCSVASKDVVGKTIPKTRRGRVTGWSASAAGLITVGVGSTLLLRGDSPLNPTGYGLLLAGGGLLWIIAALVFAQSREFAGETSGGGNALTEAVQRLDILRTDKPFRRFVITRSLLLCSALTAPYYVVLAQQHLGSPGYLLGLFMLASGAASLVSAPFWGQFADRSSRSVMVAAAIITALLGCFIYLIATFKAHWLTLSWLLPFLYFLLAIAHQGVRVGRKTYVVDLASGNKRTDYVAVSNSVIGLVLLLLGFSGALVSVVNISGIILGLSLLGALGALMGYLLPDVE